MDNLQSMTYQTFEQDPVKYERYEEVGTLSRGSNAATDNCIDDRQFSEHLWNGQRENGCECFD
jgi:hypothetical protein